jgi:DNA-binding response OmpR family regulator
MSGYDLARGIRKLACGPQTLLIAVTGWGQEKDRQLAFEAGFDHHMVKPVRAAVLEELLASAPRRSAGRPASGPARGETESRA